MTTLLLAVIYILFIGIGVPDSLFGVAWPAIYPEFGVGVSGANWVTVTVAAFTVLSSLLSARLISRFGTSLVAAVSTALTGKNFSPDIALSISGLQLTATYSGILVMPALFGLLAQTFSTALYPWYLLVLTLLTAVSFFGTKSRSK